MRFSKDILISIVIIFTISASIYMGIKSPWFSLSKEDEIYAYFYLSKVGLFSPPVLESNGNNYIELWKKYNDYSTGIFYCLGIIFISTGIWATYISVFTNLNKVYLCGVRLYACISLIIGGALFLMSTTLIYNRIPPYDTLSPGLLCNNAAGFIGVLSLAITSFTLSLVLIFYSGITQESV